MAPHSRFAPVEYDVESEIKALVRCGLPRADWLAKTFWAPRR